ncbi:MAG TPA: transferase [Opitutae bacterium]|nr:transferase [Opitutae bacterium]
MKILRVIASIDPKNGGPIEGLKRASLAMSDMGVDVEIACVHTPTPFDPQSLPWKVHYLGGHQLGSYAYAPKMKTWLEANAPHYDAVIIHGMWQYHGFATSRACRKLGVPYFVYTHGMLDPWFNEAYPLKKLKKQLYWRWGEHPVLSNASAVLFTSEEECRLARKSFSPYEVNEKVIGYGTTAPDLDREALTARIRTQDKPWGARPYFIYLGRIQEKKGLDLLVAAYAALRQTQPTIPDLVIVGPQQQPDYAKRIQSEYNQNGIYWPEALDGEEKWAALTAAEALTLVSHQENFGLVVAEALAVGTPVLISDKVNIWREIADGNAGFVQPDTHEGAEQLLTSWLNQSQTDKAQMANQAKAVYHEHFEIRKATERLVDYIETKLKP